MRKSISYIAILLLFLTGCNLPVNQGNQPTPTIDLVATQVVELLTQQPTNTPLPPPPTLQPTETSAPTQPPEPTITPSVTPTTNPGDPALSFGDPSWQDNLDTAKNFYLFESDNTKIEDEGGSLGLTGVNANGWLGWSLTYAQNPQDFYLEYTFQTRTCSGADIYGMVFRANKENAGYFFGVTCDGRYNLYARDFNNNIDNELIALKSSAAIRSGADQANRLGVLAQGSKLSLYVNGTLVDEINDSNYASGYFGAFIAANQTTGFRVELDQIKLWKF